MSVNYELYKVFYYVGHYLSFSQAAKHLYISQSAVSQSIKQLEEQLGSRLFLRHSKRVKFTPEGELLFAHVQQGLNAIQLGEKALMELHSLERGEIRIAASDTICKYYLLPYFKEFHERYPKVKLRILNRTSPVCLELLKSGAVDIGVINLPEEMPEEIKTVRVQEIQDVFVANSSFSLLKDKVVPLKELAQYPILMLEKDTVTRQFFDKFQAERGLTIVPELETGSLDLLIELAKIGLGIALVTKDFLGEELTKGDLFVIRTKEKIPGRKLGVVTPAHTPLSPAAGKFISLFVYPKMLPACK